MLYKMYEKNVLKSYVVEISLSAQARKQTLKQTKCHELVLKIKLLE